LADVEALSYRNWLVDNRLAPYFRSVLEASTKSAAWIDQRRRNIDIVDRFEQSKAPNFRLMERVVIWVVARLIRADYLAISFGGNNGGACLYMDGVCDR